MTNKEEVRKIYEEEVSKLKQFNYHCVDRFDISFEKIAILINENNYDVRIFLDAMFDFTWYSHTKKGFRKLDFPFPSMLYGEKAKYIYQKYLEKYNGKPEIQTIESEIERSCKIAKMVHLTNDSDLLDLFLDGRISLYYLVLHSGFSRVMNAMISRGEIDEDFKKQFDLARRFIFNLPSQRFYTLSSLVRSSNGK